MATYTPNYGLHQWVPEDNFQRTDFNEDFLTIDTHVGALERAVVNNAYNAYNLALQNYYDGKTTAWKKTLIFDGFVNAAQVAGWDLGLELDTAEGFLRVAALGESDGGRGVTGTLTHVETNVKATPPWTASGSGHLTGLTLYFTGTLKVELLEDGVAAPLVSGTFTGTGPGATFCPLEADVGAGRSYHFSITNPDGNPVTFYYGNDPGGSTTWLPYTRHVTPTPVTEASLTSIQTQLGVTGHSRALAWVRYQGGSVAVELNDGTGWQGMTADSIRSTVNAGGAACQEASFSLEGLTGSALQVRLTLTGSAQNVCTVYDYGVTVL